MSSLLTEGTGIIVGVGVGAAASAALEPAIEIPRQDAWQQNPNRILDINLLARLVAQGGIDLPSAHAEGLRDGYQPNKVDALVYLEQTVPGIGLATDLWRKGLLDPTLYQHVLDKSGLDTRYMAPIVANKTAELVGLGDIAYAIVRGILPSPSYVPVPPPTSGNTVPRYPQVNLDPVQLAAEIGYGPEMLQLMVGRSGLSLAPGLAANAYFRGLIGAQDFLLAIAEGDLRTEWAQTLQDVSRQILTSGEYAELQLRGFMTQAQRRKGTDQHGMSHADSDNLYNVLGRAINPHQVTIGLARGGSYTGNPTTAPSPYLESLQRGNVRPEWYDLAFHAEQYTYPSAFVFRQLLKDGAITQAQGHQYFLELGWPPSLATLVSQAYGTATAAADPHVTKAETQLWTTTHAAYKDYGMPQTQAAANLTAIGVPAAAQAQIFALWDAERASYRHGLTVGNIHKAYTKGDTNDATGQPWTKAEAVAELVQLGYNQAEADQYLDIP